jgi:hypothetical protein
MAVRFSSVCDGDLADGLAGDERAGALPAGQALRDAQHQPPVDQDAERCRHRDQHPLLHLAKGHEIEPGALLEARQHLRQPSRFSWDTADTIG